MCPLRRTPPPRRAFPCRRALQRRLRARASRLPPRVPTSCPRLERSFWPPLTASHRRSLQRCSTRMALTWPLCLPLISAAEEDTRRRAPSSSSDLRRRAHRHRRVWQRTARWSAASRATRASRATTCSRRRHRSFQSRRLRVLPVALYSRRARMSTRS